MFLPLETNENTYHAISSFDNCARDAESAERSYRELDNKALIFNLSKRPTRRGINRAGYVLSWIFRGETPLDC